MMMSDIRAGIDRIIADADREIEYNMQIEDEKNLFYWVGKLTVAREIKQILERREQ